MLNVVDSIDRFKLSKTYISLNASRPTASAVLGYFARIMAESDKPPKTIGDLIDHLEMIREELLGLQRSLEKMESIDFLLADVQKKGFGDDGRLR